MCAAGDAPRPPDRRPTHPGAESREPWGKCSKCVGTCRKRIGTWVHRSRSASGRATPMCALPHSVSSVRKPTGRGVFSAPSTLVRTVLPCSVTRIMTAVNCAGLAFLCLAAWSAGHYAQACTVWREGMQKAQERDSKFIIGRLHQYPGMVSPGVGRSLPCGRV